MPDEGDGAAPQEEWQRAHAQHLAVVNELLLQRLRLARSPSDPAIRTVVAELEGEVGAAAAAVPVMTVIEELASRFGLDAFSAEALLLGVAFEVDGRFPAETGSPFATVGLATGALPEADWSAFTPSAPLAQWSLVEVDGAVALRDATYRVAPHALHHVMGLAPEPPSFPFVLVEAGTPSAAQRSGSAAVVGHLDERDRDGRLPVVALHGGDAGDRRALAAHVSAALGRDLHVVDVADLPDDDLAATARRWDGRARLDGSALLVDAEEPLDATDRRRLRAVTAWVTAPLFLSGPIHPPVVPGRTMVPQEVARPTAPERRERWSEVIGEMLDGAGVAPADDLDLAVARLAEHDELGLDAIDRIGGQVASALAGEEGVTAAAVMTRLTTLARARRSSELDSLAERVTPVAGEVLVLPEAPGEELHELEQHLRWSHRVADEWGMRRARSGLAALFAGPSGTGKTLAARTLATALGLDLFRVDLSALTSKYIGETEKNLRRIFDAARGGGVVLLFDEADALFAKRSEVKESHDRFANSQTAFLLQELEATTVPCILTTNMRDAIDPAFVRRLRFIVDFPFPDAPSRRRIWEAAFPATVPTRGLRPDLLANLAVSGATIASIATRAAFLAAATDGPVTMAHLLDATQREARKIRREVGAREIDGWVDPEP